MDFFADIPGWFNAAVATVRVWLNPILMPIVPWLNSAANALSGAFAFIGVMPGWLSATLIAIVSGMILILGFKWTSNQTAIKKARADIRANLLTVKLFYDNMPAGFRAQGLVLYGALRLLVYAVVPIIALFLPVMLLLGQLSLWYQARPLRTGEETVIVVKLSGEANAPMPAVTLEPTTGLAYVFGPVQVLSQREVCWNVRAGEPGLHRLVFKVDGQAVEKELAVGDGFMPVSLQRTDWEWFDALTNPREAPFPPAAAVRSIKLEYPTRSSWTSGADYWVIYWFVVSLVAGFCCRGIFRVNL